jgi:phosphoribosylformylglycinamidine cyclo-ligase
MMSEMTKKPGLDYAAAGVNYGTLDASKILAQKAARATAGNLARHGAAEIEASRGESAYLVEVGGMLIASITECLGTKALVADAVRPFSGRTHYATIAQDTLAMAVNDLVTVGATPLSAHAYWSAGSSEWFADQERIEDLVGGWQRACDVCGIAWGGGETPALGGVVEAERIDLAASCVGIVKGRDRLMLGERLAAGDAIVLLASSGIHANGISLARKLAEQLPDGYRTHLADGRTFGEALLDPTVLYSPITEQLFAAGVRPHYAVNVTGHGWRKLMRHPAELRYVIRSVPPVPSVLEFLRAQGGMSARDAYGTFNMGAGFALFVARSDVAATLGVATAAGLAAWHAGDVHTGAKSLVIEPLGLEYAAGDLHLRA